MKTVLLPLDLAEPATPTADDLVAQAAGLAQSLPACIWLIHVVDPDVGPEGRLEFVAQDIRDYLAAQLKKERLRLHDYALRLAAMGIQARPLLVRGRPAETILEQTRRRHADLLIMGWPRHGTLYRTLLGSVTDSVMRDCPCPVLVMPHPSHRPITALEANSRRQSEPSPTR